MYYENRQKLLQQEKSSLVIKGYENPFILSRIEPCKLNGVLNLPLHEDAKIENKDESNLEKVDSTEQVFADEVNKGGEKANNTSVTTDYKVEEENGLLKIGSLSINPKKAADINPVDGGGADSPVITLPVETVNAAKPVDIVTVGSMPVKVNGYTKSVGSLTVGTISLDPIAHKANGTGLSAKIGSKKG